MPVTMKNLITDTYQQLLEQKSIDKITVKDLVDACGISRQTFYYHFKDIFDVLDWSIERKMNQVLEKSLKQSAKEDAIRIFVETTVRSRTPIEKCLHSSKREHIEAVFMNCLTSYFRTLFRTTNPNVRISTDEEEVLLKFCSGGVAHLLLAYCDENHTDVEHLTSQICILLSAVGDQYIGR